jgi:RecA/RadA recombinase
MASKRKKPDSPAPKKRAARKRATEKHAVKETAGKQKSKKAAFTPVDPDSLPQVTFRRRFDKDEEDSVYSGMAENIHKSITKLSEIARSRPINVHTPHALRKMLFTLDDIYFQHMLGSVGLRTPTLVDIIAPEGLGKTSLCFMLAGRALDSGCYAAYIECESKLMKPAQIKRLLHRDKKRAAMLYNALPVFEARTLLQFDDYLRRAMVELRERCDSDPRTKGNPIFIFADPWSRLMAPTEAEGVSDWDEKTSKNAAATGKVRDANAVSNQQHAKYAHLLSRRLPKLMEDYNACVFLFRHKNVKVDMKARASYMQPSELDNDTSIGGKAFAQLASYRIVMESMGDIRATDKTVVGLNVRMKVKKNAYGPPRRTCAFALYFDRYNDTEDTYDSVISFAESTALWMAQEKLLGTTVTANRYTCDALGCVAVTARDLYDALLNNPEQLQALGASLGIEGYENSGILPGVTTTTHETPEMSEDDERPSSDGAGEDFDDFGD